MKTIARLISKRFGVHISLQWPMKCVRRTAHLRGCGVGLWMAAWGPFKWWSLMSPYDVAVMEFASHTQALADWGQTVTEAFEHAFEALRTPWGSMLRP